METRIYTRKNTYDRPATDTAKLKEKARESWKDNQYSTLEQKQYNTP
jgi:hypothetical protein